ncbi:hypothetical protein SARC_10831 [Sphaeroforma arctica JP610]|uniref:Cytochrome P450 n=1 Tax=Sphaeroforma arctica JP610 TaxID=667725 RepID=A0A0L0FIW0_9EUKA|nr:hypothetical protein SARC_10831 [Sphaeroforma arctica JP610]KNC76685.1 hypothetical protein SARC_10831 [Sphaeroforma arctica JP610]|eukprot:XP_014150587.1 hypothetical protein SARC_10831 [Sphaeroforma arctica JP610]
MLDESILAMGCETLQYLFRDWFGEGIFAVDGHQWKVQRKTSSHIFTTKSLREEMAPVFVDHIEEGVRTLGKAADSGEVVNITQFFLNLTMNTFGQIAFGVDLS